MFALALLGLTSAAALPPSPHPSQVRSTGCEPSIVAAIQQRATAAAPLRLIEIVCLPFASPSFGANDTVVSPDGRLVARWHGGSPAPIEIASMAGNKLAELPDRVTFRSFTDNFDGVAALAWGADSRSLLGVRQDTLSPSGFGLNGLEPIRIDLTGRITRLPDLRHSAGPLDGLRWVGPNGLALARFGTRGGHFRPEHDDPDPTIAIVDAVKGKILATLRGNAIPPPRKPSRDLRVDNSAATVLPDGRVRAAFEFRTGADRIEGRPGQAGARLVTPGLRVVWTQGEKPRVAPVNLGWWMALTPDGTRLLSVYRLQASGVVHCEIYSPCGHRPPDPTTAPIAELTDLRTGRLLWRLTLRAAEEWGQQAAPAISPDGRFALFEIPPETGQTVALVDLRTGRIVTRFSAVRPFNGPESFQYSADGRSFWVFNGSHAMRYAFEPR